MPLTQKQIKDEAGIALDRITIWRCLRLFIQRGIASQLKDENGRSKYFLNKNDGKNHVHFKCTNCGKLSELTAGGIRYGPMPKGYTPEKRNLFIVGICNKCTKREVG